LFCCRTNDQDFAPPSWFVRLLLASDLLVQRLPRIQIYTNRPVFDENFRLCSPGWHPDSGILVHGQSIEPVLPGLAADGSPAIDRLPPHTRTLLSGFCFSSEADLVGALSMFLTGLMANHFVTVPKGLFLVDGNQPGIGKSWLIRCLGVVLDGNEPKLIPYLLDDTELEKRICALLRSSPQSLIWIDNAKAPKGQVVSSQVIEANSVAPEISLRILGRSENFVRPNNYLWAITMNDTCVSSDLSSRGVAVRFSLTGQPENRVFLGPPPIEYAQQHRHEILGELAGMVIRWNQNGRPVGSQSHRSHQWATEIGGILAANGFPEFLANASEAAATFNSQLEQLAALAEAAIKIPNGPFRVITQSQEHQ
jgi:hypothetical protein